MTTKLGLRARLRLPYAEAMQKTIDSLKAEGFGVLTEIDVQATLTQHLSGLSPIYDPWRVQSAFSPPCPFV